MLGLQPTGGLAAQVDWLGAEILRPDALSVNRSTVAGLTNWNSLTDIVVHRQFLSPAQNIFVF